MNCNPRSTTTGRSGALDFDKNQASLHCTVGTLVFPFPMDSLVDWRRHARSAWRREVAGQQTAQREWWVGRFSHRQRSQVTSVNSLTAASVLVGGVIYAVYISPNSATNDLLWISRTGLAGWLCGVTYGVAIHDQKVMGSTTTGPNAIKCLLLRRVTAGEQVNH